MKLETLVLAPLLARRELWLLVSVGFVDPYYWERLRVLQDTSFRRRANDAAFLLTQENSTTELGLGEEYVETLLPEALFAAFDGERDTLKATYHRMFGVTAISQHCPACEMEYDPNTDIAYRSQRLADVGGFYRAFGLQLSTRAGERLDHITVETEFLYLLLAKEAAALEVGNQKGAEVCREARRKFFQDHVGWWVPAFARLLTRAESSGYYHQLARLTAGLSALERVSLGLPPFKALAAPKPSQMGAQDECFECISRQETP